MLPGLNYKEDDPKFIHLGIVYRFIESDKSKNILNRSGFRKRSMAVKCLKIFFTSLFFNYSISKVIDELNNKEELRNFAGISDVPTEHQVSEYFSRYDICRFFKLSNSILSTFFKPHKTTIDEYIVDATPVACDINVVKQFIKDEKLKKLGLKWGYSTTKKHFIGFKVTVVLEKTTLAPVSIFIHPGAPSDARIFEQILEELERRGLIKKGDKLYFDKGYFALMNYYIAINKYKIVPLIFPKSNFDVNKIKENMSIPLDFYKDMKTFDDNVEEITALVDLTVEELKNFDDLKPVRGIIEDFFKMAKDAFGLGEFHSYTKKSMVKNILLGFVLTTIVVQCGFKTKTQLQRLSEGYLDLQPPKVDKKKQKDDDNEVEEKDTGIVIKEPQQKLITGIKKQITNLFNFSSRNSSKSKTETEIKSNDSKNINEAVKSYLAEKLTLTILNFGPWSISN